LVEFLEHGGAQLLEGEPVGLDQQPDRAIEVAENLADLEEDDTPPGEVVEGMMTRTMWSSEMPMPRRYIEQILQAYDRGGRKAASWMSQRAVARGVIRALRGRRR
jgi:hypothetical protein